MAEKCGISRFGADFLFFAHFFIFRSEMQKTQKLSFCEKVPLRTMLKTNAFQMMHAQKSLFSLFATFSFLGRLEGKKCAGAQKSALFHFFAPETGKVRFLRFGPENTSQNVMFITVFTLWRKQWFSAFSRFFTFHWKYALLLPRKFFDQRKFFAQKITSQKCWFGLCFKGCTLFFRAKNRFGALFAKSSQHFGNLRFCAKKCDFSKKSTFLVSGIPFPAPSRKTY